MSKVKVYGADWCGDTERTREHLDSLGVSYEYLDIDQDQRALAWVKQHNNGKQKLPTVEVGQTILSVPEDDALDDALRQNGFLS